MDTYTFSVSEVRERKVRIASPVTLHRPSDAFELLAPMIGDKRREHFVVVCLDVRHQVLAVETVSVGMLNASIVHPREVFMAAIKRGAAAIVVAHNHPSGDPTPSQEDLDSTGRLGAAGELLGIPLFDHVIIGGDGFTSLREFVLAQETAKGAAGPGGEAPRMIL